MDAAAPPNTVPDGEWHVVRTYLSLYIPRHHPSQRKVRDIRWRLAWQANYRKRRWN